MKNNSKSLLGALLLAMLASPAWSVNVTVTLDQLVPVYSSSAFASALDAGSATIQIGRIGVSESDLTFGSRAAFDTFLGTSSTWSAYGLSVPYELDASYKFTAAFEPFVANYGSLTLTEVPYQLYVAITSGSNLFGMYTFRSDGVQVSKFALTADDSLFFSMENLGQTGGVLNMVAVNSSLGSVRVADLATGVTSAIALIPEPTSGSLLVFGILSLALISRFRKKTGVLTV